MKYKVIHKCDWESFQKAVNKAIAKGWRPAGGVAFNRFRYVDDYCTEFDIDYVQAMTREEDAVPAPRCPGEDKCDLFQNADPDAVVVMDGSPVALGRLAACQMCDLRPTKPKAKEADTVYSHTDCVFNYCPTPSQCKPDSCLQTACRRAASGSKGTEKIHIKLVGDCAISPTGLRPGKVYPLTVNKVLFEPDQTVTMECEHREIVGRHVGNWNFDFTVKLGGPVKVDAAQEIAANLPYEAMFSYWPSEAEPKSGGQINE